MGVTKASFPVPLPGPAYERFPAYMAGYPFIREVDFKFTSGLGDPMSRRLSGWPLYDCDSPTGDRA